MELPDAELCIIDGELWEKLLVNDDFISLGIAPRPKTVFQTLVYHICHGLIMRYPLRSVLIWSWQNRKSFVSPETVEVIPIVNDNGD